MIGKMIPKLLNDPKIKKLLKKTINTKTKTKNKINTNTNTKTKKIRYSLRSKSGIITSGGLLSNNVKISKKILLGK